MMEDYSLIVAIVVALSGFAISFFIGKKVVSTKILEAELKAKSIIVDAEKEGENVKKEKLREVKDEWHQKKQDFESDTNSRKARIDVQEKEIKAREDGIEKKLQTILNKEKQLHNFEIDLAKKNEEAIENEKKAQELVDSLTQDRKSV